MAPDSTVDFPTLYPVTPRQYIPSLFLYIILVALWAYPANIMANLSGTRCVIILCPLSNWISLCRITGSLSFLTRIFTNFISTFLLLVFFLCLLLFLSCQFLLPCLLSLLDFLLLLFLFLLWFFGYTLFFPLFFLSFFFSSSYSSSFECWSNVGVNRAAMEFGILKTTLKDRLIANRSLPHP